MTVVLLGPQRFDPSVAEAARAAGVPDGRIAVITAGWQEREPEDEELSAHLGGDTVNLRLHRRADAVFAVDPQLRAAYRARQLRYRQLQDFYRIRLGFLIESARVIAHRAAAPELLREEQASSIYAINMLDQHHQRQCARVRREFNEEHAPKDRPAVARHRAEVAELLDDCVAVAIAGGHVASLVNRMHLFGLPAALRDKPVLAWSAGAMAVTETIVLFDDFPPHGTDAPQILDVGLGLVPGLVALPGPEGRLDLEDPERVAMYARRFAPAPCLVFPRRSWMIFEAGRRVATDGVLELGAEGEVRPATVEPDEEGAS